ncbi:MAG TPA: ATP synthase F1 subunit epsilon [Actinomycetota bacterium]|jgi:F-type H+-transporting ATPase subunit epsilon|nr:ATP synthase F1 subunit epsilon [Actinomycetota bacterium]
MHVSIVSPEKKVWEGEADMVVARSPEGEFAILRGHIPFLAALVPASVRVTSGSSRDAFFVSGGVLEASGSMDDYHVIVLADDAETADDITLEEARQRVEEARRRADDRDERAEAELRVALARAGFAEQESR